jgi:hypothetical protein
LFNSSSAIDKAPPFRHANRTLAVYLLLPAV